MPIRQRVVKKAVIIRLTKAIPHPHKAGATFPVDSRGMFMIRNPDRTIKVSLDPRRDVDDACPVVVNLNKGDYREVAD